MTDARCPSLLLSLSLESLASNLCFISIYLLYSGLIQPYFVSKLTKRVTTYLELIHVPKFYLKSKKCILYMCCQLQVLQNQPTLPT